MVVCGLAKQLFVSIAFMALFAMLTMNVHKGTELSRHKRLFNCARGVCHYHRGNLKPETIRDLMLHLFSSKFELEQSQLDLVKEYLSPGDAATLEQA